MFSPIKIGSRSSRLATVQVEEIARLLNGKLNYVAVTFSTKGDIDKTTSLTAQPGDDFFTDTLDQALLDGRIDAAIHSAKDLPQSLNPNLEIFALTETLDDSDALVSPYTWDHLPQGAKIGTSSLLRQEQIKALRPDIQIVDIRGTIQERINLVDSKQIDGVIIATCALKRLGLDGLIKYIFPWEGMALQGQLAVVGRRGDQHIKSLFTSIDVRQKYGKVTLVGAGPGDPDLITIKAIKALEAADCVFFDYLVDKSLLKYAPNAQHINAGKRKGDHTLSQPELSKMLKNTAMQGKNVVRLKGGDPLIFGRGADEIQYLSSYHIKIDIIPGITSAIGIPSYLGVPLTARSIASSVAFVSAHEEDEDKVGIRPVKIPSADTLVFLMGLTKLKEILQGLKDAGWDLQTPILIISNGTKSEERILKGTIQNIEQAVAQAQLKPPALIVAGQVVNFYKERPQRTFLHTGTHPEVYTSLGKIISLPMIEIKPVSLDHTQEQRLMEDFRSSDLVVLTSPAAVEHFTQIISKLIPMNELRSKTYAVIGRHSASLLEKAGMTPQVISDIETAQGLYKALAKVFDLKGKKILFPRSSLPNPFLKESMIKDGAEVKEWTIYVNVKPQPKPLPDNPDISGVLFTSPSTVTNFLADYQTIPKDWEIFAKGPVTENTLKQAGYSSRII